MAKAGINKYCLIIIAMRSFASKLLGVSASICAVHALPTISTKGAKLFTSDGKQFFNKGMLLPLGRPLDSIR